MEIETKYSKTWSINLIATTEAVSTTKALIQFRLRRRLGSNMWLIMLGIELETNSIGRKTMHWNIYENVTDKPYIMKWPSKQCVSAVANEIIACLQMHFNQSCNDELAFPVSQIQRCLASLYAGAGANVKRIRQTKVRRCRENM